MCSAGARFEGQSGQDIDPVPLTVAIVRVVGGVGGQHGPYGKRRCRARLHTTNKAKTLVEGWKDYYNYRRPQIALGKLTPSEFAPCCVASYRSMGRATSTHKLGR